MGTKMPNNNKILRRCRKAKHRGPSGAALVVSPVVCSVMASRADTVERLRAVPLFARCTKGDLRIVARHVDIVEAAEGTDVVREGDEGETFFVVLEGRAAILRHGRKIDELTPGSHFGELALLDPAPRAVTVRAVTPMLLAGLGHRIFKVLLREMPALSGQLLASLAAQLREARARHVD
jgi:CRP-like cAMP-binding protein